MIGCCPAGKAIDSNLDCQQVTTHIEEQATGTTEQSRSRLLL